MSSDTSSFVEITAKFVKRLYRSEDGSFCIGRYELTNAPEYSFVTIVGANLPELHFPATYCGEWVNDSRYGRQFRVEWIVTQLPDRTEDMEEFICSMKVGIGKKRIKKMLALVSPDKFWDTLDAKPEIFMNVSGVTEATIQRLQSNVHALNYQKELLTYLHGDLKMTGTRFKRLTTLYRGRLDDMLPDIQYNPFMLQQIGIPFLELDYFCARNSNFAVNDNRRMTAAAIQVLWDAQGQSHVCIPADLMATRLRAILSHYGPVTMEACQMFLEALMNSRFITKANGMYYLTRAYAEEKFVADTICKTTTPGLDLIRGGSLLAPALRAMQDMPFGRDTTLRRLLPQIPDTYDFVFFDCSPSLESLFNINVLVAVQYILIPIKVDKNSIEGYNVLLETVQSVREIANPDIRVLGIFMTAVESGSSLDREMIANFPLMLPDLAFKSYIRKNIDVKKAPLALQPLCFFSPRCTATQDYAALCDEMLERLEA